MTPESTAAHIPDAFTPEVLASAPPSATLAALGFVDDATVCRMFNISPRTLERRVAEGLPVIKLGGRRLFSLESLRDHLLSQERGSRPAPRAPGRPSKRAA